VKRYYTSYSFLLFILIFPLRLSAQLSVIQGSAIGMTPLQFVQTYLAGQGVTVTNATFNGLSISLNNIIPSSTQDQIGSFVATNGAGTQLGLAGGVLLSTGLVQSNVTGNNTNNQTQGGSDPDLVILATPPLGHDPPPSIQDKSILEFDFVPETDVITFRYVFASTEFDTYCTQNFNDAFGLFLSGPDITGSEGFLNNAVNIALLPTSGEYVNIHNICNADNGNITMNGVYSWCNLLYTYFSYYRFSYVFTASHPVTCGLTYHMKFAIGDAGDDMFDSSVFLEQNSFTSNDVTANTTFSNPQTGSLLVPGCSTSDLIYQIDQVKSSDVVIDLSIDGSGTATQADILPNPFPTQVIIPAGQLQSVPITISAVPSALGPDKTLVILASNPTCTSINSVTTTFTLRYTDALSVSVPSYTICDGSSATLTASVTGGQPFVPSNSYHYLWSNSATTPAITVSPGPGHNVYSVTVTDACNQQVTQPTFVDVGVVPTTSSTITGQSDVCPPENNVVYTISPIPGADSYSWSFPAGAMITSGGNTNSVTVAFTNGAVSGPISVFGSSTICGNGPPTPPFIVTMNPSPGSPGIISGPATTCQGVTGVIFSVLPITNATSYTWSLPAGATITNGINTNSITVDFDNTAISGTVSVTGSNLLCGDGPSSLPYFLTVQAKPLPAGAILGPVSACQNSTGTVYSISPIPNSSSYSWTIPPGAIITNGNNTTTITVSFPVPATSGNISVFGQRNLCPGGDPSVLPVTVNPLPGSANSITGPATVCQGQTGVPYSSGIISDASEYVWNYTGTGTSSPSNIKDIAVDYSTTATGGNWVVFGRNSCGTGASFSYPIVVNSKPTATYQVCTPMKTLLSGRKIQLRGGFPLSGTYFAAEGVTYNALTGQYEFDPSVVAFPYPKNVVITYRYLNSHGCMDEKTQTITVFGLNADIISPNLMKDLRDDVQYSYETFGAGASAKLWMTQNLNYGTKILSQKSQTNNCIAEKFCPPSDPGCTGIGGGFYQWDELMEYKVSQGSQDLCPPGWHVPSETEWQTLIDNLDPAFSGASANALVGSELKDPAKNFRANLKGMYYLNNNNTWSFDSGTITATMFWTSTIDANGRIIARGLNNPFNASISKYPSSPANAFPVRCIRD
jgi:uncharacterized protein (TIGR02145 family)